MADFGENSSASSVIHCRGCGYSLHGLTIGGACPECGLAIDDTFRGTGGGPTSGYAIAALVFGILSILGTCAYVVPGLLFAIIALVMVHLCERELAAGQLSANSIGLMKAGRVCAIISFALVVAMFVLSFIMLLVILVVR